VKKIDLNQPMSRHESKEGTRGCDFAPRSRRLTADEQPRKKRIIGKKSPHLVKGVRKDGITIDECAAQ
jgi:hypothetical protein